MEIPQLSWKKWAVGAAAFAVVVAIGFLADAGPIQGGNAKVGFLHADDMCFITVQLEFGDINSKNGLWIFSSNSEECNFLREAKKAELTGRTTVTDSIKAAVKK